MIFDRFFDGLGFYDTKLKEQFMEFFTSHIHTKYGDVTEEEIENYVNDLDYESIRDYWILFVLDIGKRNEILKEEELLNGKIYYRRSERKTQQDE